jgi:hypothetical protein
MNGVLWKASGEEVLGVEVEGLSIEVLSDGGLEGVIGVGAVWRAAGFTS